MKVVIIGGVAGGATAAARIRRLDESAEIHVFERSGYVSYANCGLPYYIGGVITDPEELTLQTPESFWKRFRIHMHVCHEVTAIHPERKSVTVKNLETGESFEESYDKLLLSPGAKPIVPDFHGPKPGAVFTLRTVEDTFRIRSFAEEKRPRSAVLAGGGFISLELAENLCRMGMEVTIVQKLDHLLNPLDYDMASFLHGKMRSMGVRLILERAVTGLSAENDSIKVEVEDHAPLTADMVILAIGVRPDTSLAKDAGLALGAGGSIIVNSRMETSIPDIYAAGDAVQIRHRVTGKDTRIALAGPANKQGRIAADNICGGDSHYEGAQGTSIIKIFDMTFAVTGLNEQAAQAAKISYDKVYLSPSSHASYYPGARTMTMKVLFEKGSLKLLGAQIAGFDGVDKRIDVLAAAIYAGLSASALKDLDLAYAPPYASAKDPVNMAGYLIENLAQGRVKQIFWDQLKDLPYDGSALLLDVRTPAEYEKSHMEGFVNVPLDELRDHLSDLDPSKPVYVLCQSGLRSYLACRILMQHGFDCSHIAGGYLLCQSVFADRAPAQKHRPCGMETAQPADSAQTIS